MDAALIGVSNLSYNDIVEVGCYTKPPKSLVKISQVIYNLLENTTQKQNWTVLEKIYHDRYCMKQKLRKYSHLEMSE